MPGRVGAHLDEGADTFRHGTGRVRMEGTRGADKSDSRAMYEHKAVFMV